MKKCYVAVDLGATSGRLILGCIVNGRLQTEEVCRFPNKIIKTESHCYWDIYGLFHNIIEGLKGLSLRKDIILSSIGIDTWGVDFVLFGKDGDILRLPYSYRDRQTLGAPERYFSRESRQEVYRQTGIQVMDFNSLFQLDTLRFNHDSAFESADKILFIPDALSYMLTGNMVTEYTIASTSQMLDAEKRCFSESILNSLGLTDKSFGRLVFPGDVIGNLKEYYSDLIGNESVTVVAVAGHDTASAVVAVPADTDDFAYLSSGTWSLMGIESEFPIINDSTEKYNFTNEGGVDSKIRLLKNICGMWLMEQSKLQWGDVSYSQLICEASESAPFRSFINPDDCLFLNPDNMIVAIQKYCVEHNQKIPESRGQIVRCIFESLAMRYREVLEMLREISVKKINVLHIIGGGSNNEMLNQWTANAIGIPVIAGPSEATAYGNILLQAISSGEIDCIDEGRRIIRKSVGLKEYNPQDCDLWSEAYLKYKEITK